jgi:hypothetical protein
LAKIRGLAVLVPQNGAPASRHNRHNVAALGNRDLSSRVIGISALARLDEALAAVERGPLPPEGIAKLGQLWATDFFVNA